MTGINGNKLSFWRYNGNGTNAGHVLDIINNDTSRFNGNVSANNIS